MKIIIDNLAINYLDEGRGPVIVLLHGWGQDLSTFDGIVQDLASDYRVLRLDLPGFGASQKPPDSWAVVDYSSLIASFLTKLEVKKINLLVGHSFGGRIAIKAVAARLVVPRQLVLVDAAAICQSQSLRNLSFKVIAKAGKTVMALPLISKVRLRARRRLYRTAGSSDYISSGAMRQIFLNTINEDLQADAAVIGLPTLLVWGAHDNETPLDQARKLHSLINDSRLEIIDNAGHFSYIDQPAQVIRLLRQQAS